MSAIRPLRPPPRSGIQGGAFANRGIDQPHRLPHNLIIAHELHHDLNVGGETQSTVLTHDPGDVASARDGVVVIGPHAQGVAQVAEHLEACALPGPAFELVRPIGYQEVAVAPVER